MTMDDGGSDSGAFDPVDFRLTRVEADMAEVKGDIRGLRADMRADIGALRAELREDIGALRTEMREEMGLLRTEVRNEVGTLRDIIGALRDEVRAGFSSNRQEFASVNEKVSYLRGRIEQIPTTIQLGGFIIAIFVASGMTRYFGH